MSRDLSPCEIGEGLTHIEKEREREREREKESESARISMQLIDEVVELKSYT